MNSETKHIPKTETFRSDLGRFGLSDTIIEISGGLEEHQFFEQAVMSRLKTCLPLMIKQMQRNKDNYHRVTAKKE